MCYQNHNICECVEELSPAMTQMIRWKELFKHHNLNLPFKFIANKIIVQKKDNKNKSLLIT